MDLERSMTTDTSRRTSSSEMSADQPCAAATGLDPVMLNSTLSDQDRIKPRSPTERQRAPSRDRRRVPCTLTISVMRGAGVAARFAVTTWRETSSIVRLAVWTASEPRRHKASRPSRLGEADGPWESIATDYLRGRGLRPRSTRRCDVVVVPAKLPQPNRKSVVRDLEGSRR